MNEDLYAILKEKEDLYAILKEKIESQERRFWEIFQQVKKENPSAAEVEYFNGKWDSMFNLLSFIEEIEKQYQKHNKKEN